MSEQFECALNMPGAAERLQPDDTLVVVGIRRADCSITLGRWEPGMPPSEHRSAVRKLLEWWGEFCDTIVNIRREQAIELDGLLHELERTTAACHVASDEKEDGTAPGGTTACPCGIDDSCPVHGTNRPGQGTCEPQSAREQLREAVDSLEHAKYLPYLPIAHPGQAILAAARRVLAEPEPVSRRDYDSKCATLERRQNKLNAEREAHAKTRAELERVYANRDEIGESWDADESDASEREAELRAEMEETLECLGKAIRVSEGREARITELEAEVDRTQDELESFRGKFEEAAAELERLRSQLGDAENTIDDLKGFLAQLESRAPAQSSELADALAELREYHQKHVIMTVKALQSSRAQPVRRAAAIRGASCCRDTEETTGEGAMRFESLQLPDGRRIQVGEHTSGKGYDPAWGRWESIHLDSQSGLWCAVVSEDGKCVRRVLVSPSGVVAIGEQERREDIGLKEPQQDR